MVNAIIPAAGVSSRLYPLTLKTPKCLLDVGEKSLLSFQIDALKLNGIKEVCVVSGYLSDLIEKEVSSKAHIIVNSDFRETNSSYSLWLARDFMEGGFVYLNSDLFFTDSWLSHLLKNKNKSSMMVDNLVNANEDMFKVQISNQQIISMDKNLSREKSHAVGVGPVFFSQHDSVILKNYLDSIILSGEKNKWCYSIFSSILKDLKLFPIYSRDDFWCEIDTIEDYKRLSDHIRNLGIK